MKTIKGKVTIESVEHEVELPLPDGYLTLQEVQETYVPKVSVENSTAAAVRSETQKQHDKLLAGEDTDFLGEFKTRHGLIAAGDAPPDLDARLKSAETEWKQAQLTPVQKENESLQSQNEQLLQSKLISDVVSSAAAIGVKKTMLQPGPNTVPQIVNMVGSYFAWDPEHGYYAVRSGTDSEGKPTYQFSGKPKEGRPHADVAEFFTTWAEDKNNADFLEDVRQRGAGLGDEPSSRSGKDVVLTKEQASDHSTYKAAQVQAEKQGGHVIVSEEQSA